MIVDRYYYNQLSKDEKTVYKAFYNGVMAHKDIIPVPMKGNVPDDLFQKVFRAITLDNPLIYYLNQSACHFAFDSFGNAAICPQYFFSEDTVKDYNKRIEKAVNGIAAKLKLAEGSEYDKELKVHDWICENVSYDTKGHDMNDLARFISAHNIIGVFAHHKAQCEGIAKAVKVLLNAVDVKCIVATGNAIGNGQNGPHAWNIVKIDDKAYHMDMTWDIGANQGKAVKKSSNGRIVYDYFNVTDKQLFLTHTPDDKLPGCTATDANYFRRNKMYFSSKSRALSYVEASLKKGITEFNLCLNEKISLTGVEEAMKVAIHDYLRTSGHTGGSVVNSINDKMRIIWMKVV